jgi:GNAT superfamily N-acetyltransferase
MQAATLGDTAWYALATFLLYLRVSGLFHLIVGLLRLFGFALPETHHLYYLSSSFTDFWRRINIYWKEFLTKVVFYPTFVRLYTGAAFDSGSVHAVEHNAGVAMWLPPGIGSDEEGLADLFRRSVEPSRLAEIFDLVQQMASYQPAEPHWFLPLIGADPTRRGKGYGSALLAHMMAQWDHDQQLAYLDRTNSRNVPLRIRAAECYQGRIMSACLSDAPQATVGSVGES